MATRAKLFGRRQFLKANGGIFKLEIRPSLQEASTILT
jgi:hypothetical protein